MDELWPGKHLILGYEGYEDYCWQEHYTNSLRHVENASLRRGKHDD